VALLVTGCTGSAAKGIEGTWVYGGSGITETMAISASTFTVTDTGVMVASLTCSITNHDTSAGHILMTQTAATGIYTLWPNGTVWYATYQLNDDTLLLSASDSGYPATPTTSYSRR